MIENDITEYRNKIKELKDLEKEIVDTLPEQLWDKYHLLKAEIESDKSVIQKKIKDGKESVSVDDMLFKVSTRTRTSIPDSFMYTALDLGHIETLIDIGVITGVKVNEDMVSRLDPEMAGIYSNLIEKKPYTALTWPKKADK